MEDCLYYNDIKVLINLLQAYGSKLKYNSDMDMVADEILRINKMLPNNDLWNFNIVRRFRTVYSAYLQRKKNNNQHITK